MKKEMIDIQHQELNIVPLDYGIATYTTLSEVKIVESNVTQILQESIIRASNILIKKFIGECSNITKELKQCLKIKLGGIWICIVAKGPLGISMSEFEGKQLQFAIGEYNIYTLQISK
jgi:hypothetical protein